MTEKSLPTDQHESLFKFRFATDGNQRPTGETVTYTHKTVSRVISCCYWWIDEAKSTQLTISMLRQYWSDDVGVHIWIKVHEMKIFWCIGSGDTGDFRRPLPTPKCTLYILFCMGNAGINSNTIFGTKIRHDAYQLSPRTKRKWNLRKNLVLIGPSGYFYSRFSQQLLNPHLNQEAMFSRYLSASR